MLDLALLLTHRLFAIPAAVPYTDRVVVELADRVLERLVRTAEAPPGPYVVSSFHRRLRERRRDRLSYATRTLFTPRVAHYRRLPLPSALRWLHVPLKLPWDHILTPAIGLARRMSRPASRYAPRPAPRSGRFPPMREQRWDTRRRGRWCARLLPCQGG
jgi:hypothetical protein